MKYLFLLLFILMTTTTEASPIIIKPNGIFTVFNKPTKTDIIRTKITPIKNTGTRFFTQQR